MLCLDILSDFCLQELMFSLGTADLRNARKSQQYKALCGRSVGRLNKAGYDCEAACFGNLRKHKFIKSFESLV